jgi:hypothetical protein
MYPLSHGFLKTTNEIFLTFTNLSAQSGETQDWKKNKKFQFILLLSNSYIG